MLALRKQHHLQNAVSCEDHIAKISVLISHINAHAVRGRPTLDDVESFRNGPVHELYSLKANQMCEVHTSSQDITEPNVSSNYENTSKPVKADLTTNYDAETNTSLAVKIKNVREHNFEGGSNNSELDKDTDRSNLNSKVKYLSLALPLNILFLLLVLLGSILVRYDLVFHT